MPNSWPTIGRSYTAEKEQKRLMNLEGYMEQRKGKNITFLMSPSTVSRAENVPALTERRKSKRKASGRSHCRCIS
jgi:hypothetical protein